MKNHSYTCPGAAGFFHWNGKKIFILISYSFVIVRSAVFVIDCNDPMWKIDADT